MCLSFTNKALPISVQGFGASLAPISFFTADDIYTAVSPTVDLPMNSILYSTVIRVSNPSSHLVKMSVLPLELSHRYGGEGGVRTHARATVYRISSAAP